MTIDVTPKVSGSPLDPGPSQRAHPGWCSADHCRMESDTGWGYHQSAPVELDDLAYGELSVRTVLQLLNWAEAMGPDCDGYVDVRIESKPLGERATVLETSFTVPFAAGLAAQLARLAAAADSAMVRYR